jgi:hypothetical protein
MNQITCRPAWPPPEKNVLSIEKSAGKKASVNLEIGAGLNREKQLLIVIPKGKLPGIRH